jgi:hypothetical protein
LQLPQVFRVSPQTLKSFQKTNWAVFIHLALAVFIFLFHIAFPEHPVPWIYIVFYLLFLLSGFAFALIRCRFFESQSAQQFLVVMEKGIVHLKNGTRIHLDHRKIIHIVVREKKDGEYCELELYTRDGVLKLSGFENLKHALEAMKPYIDDLVVIVRKRLTCMDKPWILIHIPLSLVAAAVCGLYVHAPELLVAAYYIAWTALAAVLWIKKPISRFLGKHVRGWEYVLASLFVIWIGFSLKL